MQSDPLHLFQSYWNVNNCRNENPDKEIFFIHSVITTIQNYLKHELYLFPVPTVTHPVVIWYVSVLNTSALLSGHWEKNILCDEYVKKIILGFSPSVQLLTRLSFFPTCTFSLCFYFNYGFNLQLISFSVFPKALPELKEEKKKEPPLFICKLPHLHYSSKILLNPSKIDLTYLLITDIFSCRNPWPTIWVPLSQKQKSWYWRKSNSS